MANNDFRLPDDFPDLSLPERADRPADPPERVSRDPLPSLSAPATQRTWNIGDRVLAPWQPNFLYAGTISRIEEGQALIEFDNDAAGAVFLDQLSPLELAPGTRIFMRRTNNAYDCAAVVVEVRDNMVRVQYQKSNRQVPTDDWVFFAALRVPCEPFSEGAAVIRAGGPRINLCAGTRVWAPWTPEVLFPGTVHELSDNEAHIHFDDGDHGWVQINQVVPLDLFPGMKFLVRRSRDFADVGTLLEIQQDRLYVSYEDGKKEWTKIAAIALPCQPVGPPAKPTRSVHAPAGADSGTGWGWAVWLVIVVVCAILRAGCR